MVPYHLAYIHILEYSNLKYLGKVKECSAGRTITTQERLYAAWQDGNGSLGIYIAAVQRVTRHNYRLAVVLLVAGPGRYVV